RRVRLERSPWCRGDESRSAHAATGCGDSQESRVEGPGEDVGQAQGLKLAVQVHQDDLEVPAELPQNLAAGPAGRSESIGIGGNGDAREADSPFGDSLQHSDSFGANGETVGGVLDVATREDGWLASIGGGLFERRTDLEARVGCMGLLPGGDGGLNEAFPARAHREHDLTATRLRSAPTPQRKANDRQ